MLHNPIPSKARALDQRSRTWLSHMRLGQKRLWPTVPEPEVRLVYRVKIEKSHGL